MYSLHFMNCKYCGTKQKNSLTSCITCKNSIFPIANQSTSDKTLYDTVDHYSMCRGRIRVVVILSWAYSGLTLLTLAYLVLGLSAISAITDTFYNVEVFLFIVCLAMVPVLILVGWATIRINSYNNNARLILGGLHILAVIFSIISFVDLATFGAYLSIIANLFALLGQFDGYITEIYPILAPFIIVSLFALAVSGYIVYTMLADKKVRQAFNAHKTTS